VVTDRWAVLPDTAVDRELAEHIASSHDENGHCGMSVAGSGGKDVPWEEHRRRQRFSDKRPFEDENHEQDRKSDQFENDEQLLGNPRNGTPHS